MPPIPELPGEHFTIVAARGGDDIWIEIRRRQVPDEDRIPLELFAPDPTTPAVARPPAPPAVRSSRATTQVPARSIGEVRPTSKPTVGKPAAALPEPSTPVTAMQPPAPLLAIGVTSTSTQSQGAAGARRCR